MPTLSMLMAAAAACLLAGCVTRAVDVLPTPTSPAEFALWDCERLDDERDSVQQRAADTAYAVEERAGNNILALGVGATLFWPAMLAMRPVGPEAAELARLKGRFEALNTAAGQKGCPHYGDDLPPDRAAALPVALGDRLVYEDRVAGRGPGLEWALTVSAVRRGEIEYRGTPPETVARDLAAKVPPVPPVPPAPRELVAWHQDRAGNLTDAPNGALAWPHLLRAELVLGSVTAGDIVVVGDPLSRARMRGQVVAVGPQTVAGRRFDVAVVELFGDAPRGEAATRVDGAIVVDRRTGVLLRLDLRSAEGSFSLQRRLMRVEGAR